jgi:subtilase family serine protease
MFLNSCWKGLKPRPGKPGGAGRRALCRPQLEPLEDRTLPSVTPNPVRVGGVYKPPVIVHRPPIGPLGSPTPPTTAYTPQQIRHAYGVDQIAFSGIVGDGTGQTIAIVDAFDDPKFVNSTDPNFVNSDLHQFDLQFGLPDPPSFQKVDQTGGTNYPGTDPTGNFETEIALDVEWAHVIAPNANIVLVEANDSTGDNLFQAASFAASIPQVSVVSMSFGSGEFTDETQLDSIFTTPAGHQGVTFLASTGDSGAPGGYPAYSPNVVAVGGTSLTADAAGNYISESGWSGSGGGISQFEPQPSYQNGVVTQSTTQRTIPDVSMVADPNTGVAVYDSFNNPPSSGGPWIQVGGTSLACPLWAGLIAVADQGRVQFGKTTLDGPSQTLPMLYSMPASDFNDITTGNNGFAAGPGYDLVTGRGSPTAQVVLDLAGPPPSGGGGSGGVLRNFHPFRYVFTGSAAAGQSGATYTGNLTVANGTTQTFTGNLILEIVNLPAGVTLNPSVTTTTAPDGGVAIPLLVSTLPPQSVTRVTITLDNPQHVPISTFLEGFDLLFVMA